MFARRAEIAAGAYGCVIESLGYTEIPTQKIRSTRRENLGPGVPPPLSPGPPLQSVAGPGDWKDPSVEIEVPNPLRKTVPRNVPESFGGAG